ncbi:MAG: DUF3592 domain-containing protein [Micrococcales bacterium]|nr:DUF3592 domain-containing protein [Micrococcales bacterium]
MSTIDPAVARAQKEERQKGGIGSLAVMTVAAAGCLVAGYLFGRAFAGIFATFRWMEAQGINEMETSEGLPYFWGLFVGIFGGLVAGSAYSVSSKRFTGGVALPVGSVALIFAGATAGVWIQGVQWDGPTSGVMYGSGKGSPSVVMDYADIWVPAAFALITVLIVVAGFVMFVRRGVKARRVRALLDSGVRASGVVTEAHDTGVEINGLKLIKFTVKFTDNRGVQRWVTKKTTFDLAGIPTPGRAATVFYDPAQMDESKIAVTLQPLEAVELQLQLHLGVPPVAPGPVTSPPWGSADGFYRGDQNIHDAGSEPGGYGQRW